MPSFALNHTLNQTAHLSLASFPGRPFDEALARAMAGVDVPLLGRLSCEIVQLCPQNRGVLSIEMIEHLRSFAPDLELRLHANVRVLFQRMIMDIIDFDHEHPYWQQLRVVHRAIGGKVYTAHAGLRKNGSMAELVERLDALTDFLETPVAVEAHYPARHDPFLMSSWAEWQAILEADVPFVVDVSHAAIIAHLSHRREDALVAEMLQSPRCLEIHLSGNDGRADQHRQLSGDEWWWPLLGQANPNATLFYEGIHRPAHVAPEP